MLLNKAIRSSSADRQPPPTIPNVYPIHSPTSFFLKANNHHIAAIVNQAGRVTMIINASRRRRHRVAFLTTNSGNRMLLALCLDLDDEIRLLSATYYWKICCQCQNERECWMYVCWCWRWVASSNCTKLLAWMNECELKQINVSENLAMVVCVCVEKARNRQ